MNQSNGELSERRRAIIERIVVKANVDGFAVFRNSRRFGDPEHA